MKTLEKYKKTVDGGSGSEEERIEELTWWYGLKIAL